MSDLAEALYGPMPSPEAQGKFSRIADALMGGLKNTFEFPGNYMASGIDRDAATNWAAPMAMGMVGMGPIGAERGAVGAAGGKLGSGALPMDEASRMARAKEMGFAIDEPLYHGSGKSFSQFDPGKAGSASGSREQQAAFFTPEPQVADHYAQIASVRGPAPGEIPHHSFDYAGTTYHNVYDGAQIYPSVVNPGKQKVVEIPYYNTAKVDAEIQKAREQGFDTLRIKNMADTGAIEGSRADQIAVLNPANIRSRFAAFDPSKSKLADILAGITALPAAGVIAKQVNEPQQ